jgi:hypothetical protein
MKESIITFVVIGIVIFLLTKWDSDFSDALLYVIFFIGFALFIGMAIDKPDK